MSDGWATFGKGVFVALAVAGGVWIGRGGPRPILEIPGALTEHRASPPLPLDDVQQHRVRPVNDEIIQPVGVPDRVANNLIALTPQPQIGGALVAAGVTTPSVSLGSALMGVVPKTAKWKAPAINAVTQNDLKTSVDPSRANSFVDLRSDGSFSLDVTATPTDPSFDPAEKFDAIYRISNFEKPAEVSLVRVALNEVFVGGEPKPLTLPSASIDRTKVSGNRIAVSVQIAKRDAKDPVNNTADDVLSFDSSPVLIQLPVKQSSLVLTAVSNNRFGEITATVPGPVNVYDGYLRLKGTAPSGATLRVAFDQVATSPSPTKTFLREVPITVTSLNGTNWEGEVVLPIAELKTAVGSLQVKSESLDGNFSFTVPVTTNPAKFATPAIEITKISLKKDEAHNPVTRVNNPEIVISWKLKEAIRDGAVAVFLNGSTTPITADLAPNTPGDISFTLTDDAKYAIQVGVFQGNKLTGSLSPAKSVELRRDGPTPQKAEVVTSSPTATSGIVRITFDPKSPLVLTSLDKAQFVITRLGTNATVDFTSFDLNADTNTLDLRIQDLIADNYEVLVRRNASKDITDVFGNVLGVKRDSAAQKTEFRLPFTRTFGVNSTPAPADVPLTQMRGITGVTGANAEYPEYTKPRTQPEGFNPSDKVVTRIARLYYFRDAHRVVQLLNREARSFNRQAVDQQQQLADNALRDAENSTIERRASEKAAVRAASQARAAEHGLMQAQAALAQAQSENSDTANELPTAERAIRDQSSSVTDCMAAVKSAESALQSASNAMPPDATAKTNAQIKLDRANADLKAAQTKLQGLQDHRDDLVRQRDLAAARVTNATRLVNTALAEVQSSRQAEITATDKASGLEAKEDQNFKTLFRREVAAANADPDTYAKGNPESTDPLLQVTYSVIGEGEIQLRGPLKGVNMARTLINLIDSPVGQVRVAIHTVQVNGERGERMEPVVERIGRYIDQNRFLTSQSGQMLRNAVTTVAARKAEAAFVECEGNLNSHQEKYLNAFFGSQFIDELQEMDSEFLKADNKLLSLHSMDSTSLAQALFLLALAKNDARQEILFEFERLTTCELPIAETEYFNASGAKWKFGPPLHKQKYQFLGHNAKFLSLKGQFNVQVADPETITPMQREFIRLAQIFKSRLVAEREIQQRIMERGLIEDRFVDYSAKLREAARLEESAETAVKQARINRQQRISDFISHYTKAIGAVKTAISDGDSYKTTLSPTVKELLAANNIVSETNRFPSVDTIKEQLDRHNNTKRPNKVISTKLNFTSGEGKRDQCDVKLVSNGTSVILVFKDTDESDSVNGLADWKRRLLMAKEFDKRLAKWILSFDWIDTQLRVTAQQEYSRIHNTDVDNDAAQLKTVYTLAIAEEKLLSIRDIMLENVERQARSLVNLVSKSDDFQQLFPQFIQLRAQVMEMAGDDVDLRKNVGEIMNTISKELAEVLAVDADVALRTSIAASSRRPLDHKKLLDMLVDDAEDKYIEILEGTRAHTANIDNYLGRIITSLDDDFNTQFNNPTFKHIREAGRYWDVQMGQIETTTVLTNNRTFAKVSPGAQMEFDLPKRDILISEAFESAAAAYQDYGALLQDPTFLSLTKMYRGQPPSATYGSPLPTPMVRDVLPSLPSATNEQMMIQQGATSPDFPSALESLIPDPAIYKFETGTGFEVRPVIQPDGQAVTFHLNYMYTTNVREPVRADEKHLGRIKRHFVDTDVTLGNFEMREVSKYTVALKASRTSRGVPLLEDVPVAGVLFRPMPQQQSSLQQNVILSQATIFPTLFDLMGLRWAPAIADLGTGNLKELDFVTKNRHQYLQNEVFDGTGSQVDEFLRIQEANRRRDLYRPQTPIEHVHPDGTVSPGMNMKELRMFEEPAETPIRESNSRPVRRPQQTTQRSFPNEPPGLEPPPSPIQRQSYEVPAVESRSKKPELLPQYAPAAPRKSAVRPVDSKQAPKDKARSTGGLGSQSSQYRPSENKIALASASQSAEVAPARMLDHDDDLFARQEIRPVSDLKASTGFSDADKDDSKRRWFKLPYINRSK
ncbi:MAG: hypothetical protein U0941_31120 [Planctomycetaceae bacterium]